MACLYLDRLLLSIRACEILGNLSSVLRTADSWAGKRRGRNEVSFKKGDISIFQYSLFKSLVRIF